MDNYAEKYFNLSPYNYVVNNPISNTDPTGDTIVLQMMEGQNVLDFWMGVKAYVDLRNNSKSAEAMFDDLANSEETYTFNFSSDFKEGVFNKESKVASIPINEKHEKTLGFMAHESGHAWRNAHGFDPAPFGTEPKRGSGFIWALDEQKKWNKFAEYKRTSEDGAVHIENMIKAELGIELREFYPVKLPDVGTPTKTNGIWSPNYESSPLRVVEKRMHIKSGHKYKKRFQKNLHETHNVKPLLLFILVFFSINSIAQNSECELLWLPVPIKCIPDKKEKGNIENYISNEGDSLKIVVIKTITELYEIIKQDSLWTIFKYIPNKTSGFTLSSKESYFLNKQVEIIIDDQENNYIMLYNKNIFSEYNVSISMVKESTIIKQLNVTYYNALLDLPEEKYKQIQSFLDLYNFILENLINKFP